MRFANREKIQPGNHRSRQEAFRPHSPVFRGIKSLTGVIPNKEEAPSPITTTWDRYLLQKCGTNRAAPNKIDGSPRRGPILHFVRVDEDFLSLQKQQPAIEHNNNHCNNWGNWCFSARYYQKKKENKATTTNTSALEHQCHTEKFFFHNKIAK